MANWEDKDGYRWTVRLLARTQAANLDCENSLGDSRRQLAHIGPLQAYDVRCMAAEMKGLTFEEEDEEEAKVEAWRKKRDRKRLKEEEAARIAHRKALLRWRIPWKGLGSWDYKARELETGGRLRLSIQGLLLPRPPLCPSPPNLILPRRLPPARRINSSIIQWPPRVEQRPSRAHHIASHQRHAGANVPRPRKRMNGARRPMRTHQHSRQRSGSPGFRRGGVRKKNARFDIPPERSLQNIDQLISESINDDEIRELKKEKLLLRNRQAALNSRHGKKKRTEELEKKKLYTERNYVLEDEAKKLQIQLNNFTMERRSLCARTTDCRNRSRRSLGKKSRLVEDHMLETAVLSLMFLRQPTERRLEL
ncbi:hypothetical protein K432DRAFT_395902 [Lepidopterella palustris CBS 459.81]|uniref:BZIP domain-containing protein n=1 Tax=Lepidopterella palustris CBS 459.81 TaxID=1314670 RepID=A0A8E2E465_9PEZI|nr:hypothetical protein K432DRAFT_395902 [Lepidopterella palustris CBS 459.81]